MSRQIVVEPRSSGRQRNESVRQSGGASDALRVGGSVIGALSHVRTPGLHINRREVVARKITQLEQLYSDFINDSARLLVDALQHSLENPGMLVPLYALLSRIRLGSSTDVIESGERVIATIFKTYFEPNLSPEELQAAASSHHDHLQEFSNACRRELESLEQKILRDVSGGCSSASAAGVDDRPLRDTPLQPRRRLLSGSD